MSSQPNHSALVERLFDRFAAIFGTQKVGAMWDGVTDQPEVVRVWADQLSRFQPQSIGLALQAVVDSGREWPPTLPEFVELCRQSAIGRQNAAAIPYSPIRTDADVARANLDRPRAMLSRVGESGRADPLRWAKYPKSLQAVQLMVRGAKRHEGLREVVRGHVNDAGERLPNDDAVRYFTAALERDHSLLAPVDRVTESEA